MKTLLFTLFLGIAAVLSSQTGIDQIWEAEFDNPVGDQICDLKDILVISDGYLIAGEASNANGATLYVAKVDNNGQTVWDLYLPSERRSWVTNLAVDAQGNIYAAGVETRLNFNDRIVRYAKIEPDGDLVWEKTYSGTLDIAANLMDMTVVGDYMYLCGEEETTNGYDIGWVAKFDLNGNLAWENASNVGDGAAVNKVVVGDNGQVVVLGYYDFEEGFLASQYASDGTEDWLDTIPSDGGEMGLIDGIIQSNGDVFALGFTESPGGLYTDINTLKYGATGNLEWVDTLNTGNENEPDAIFYDDVAGNIIATGTSNRSFKYRAWIKSFTPAGMVNWEAEHIVTDDTEVRSSSMDENGNIYLGVQPRDQMGVFKISPTGQFVDTMLYSNQVARFADGIASANGRVAFFADFYFDSDAILIALDANSLMENFMETIRGKSLSNEVPHDLQNDGQFLWQSTTSYTGDSTYYSITKLDLAGNVQWKKSRKSKGSVEDFITLETDGSGNTIHYFGSGSFSGDDGIGLVKYDSAGNEVIYEYKDTSGGDVLAGGLTIDPSGNIYTLRTNSLNPGVQLSKYAPDGTVLWRKYLKENGSRLGFQGLDMRWTEQDKLVVAASDRVNNNNDIHLYQFDSGGNHEWDTIVNSSTGNLVNLCGLEIEPNSDIKIFGRSGTFGYFCAKYDINGNELWIHTGFLASGTSPRSMVTDENENTYLLFSTKTGMDIKKLDVNGNLLNDESIELNTSGSFLYPEFSTYSNGQVVTFGMHLMPGLQAQFNMMIDTGLNVTYAHVDSSISARVASMTEDLAGNVYVNYESGDLGSSFSGRTTLLRKYAIGVVGLDNIQHHTYISIDVWPNPVKDRLYLSDEFAGKKIILFDMTGSLIYTGTLPDKDPGIDVSRLSPGVYGYHVSDELKGKFVKME